jgi:hypothetical protein
VLRGVITCFFNGLWYLQVARRLHFFKTTMKINHLLLTGLAILTVGCQSAQPVKQSAAENGSFMGLWSVYSHCQSAKDWEELQHDATVLRASANRTVSGDGFVLPLPGKLERLVTAPSARLAVDVKAMSAACLLRAGQAAVDARRYDVAKELLKSILEYHPQSDYAFYSVQAKALLSEIDPESVRVSALSLQ